LMTEEQNSGLATSAGTVDEMARFTESYASFNRIINNLQRQYIELKEEFSAQNERLVETNRKLVAMTARNLEATEFLNRILGSISAGVIAVDQGGRITHFNSAASVMLGIPIDKPRGEHYRDVIPPGDPIDANALRAAESGRPVDSVEKRTNLPDGTALHLSVSTAILCDDEGKPNGAVEVFHDLTKVKKMEAEIARLNTLAALGEMAATIAHQVRNPLAGIGGFAALLKRDMESDDPRQKTVDKIVRGVENLNSTVSALLGYTRTEEVRRDEVDYGDFLKTVIRQYRHENAEMVPGMFIRLMIPDSPPAVSVGLMIDRQLCRQLFCNLLTNAVEACRGKGNITISYRKLPRQAAARWYGEKVLLGLEETLVETVVADSGSGIKPEALESVFSPFFTTKQDGNGLGLAVAWKIIKAHGGDIIAENIPGGGARFTLLFPAKVDTVTADKERANE